jgi:uncharacterized protein (DUF697 family)
MANGSEVIEGERLLSAVERLIEDTSSLVSQVEAFKYEVQAPGGDELDPDYLEDVSRLLISAYSGRAAIAGGVTAMPALLPGVGTAIAIVGGSLADVALMLKHEVELSLCLTHLYGHDIRDERERWLAFVLAGVSTYEARSGRNYFADMAEAEMEALNLYTPRQLSKLMITLMGKLALLSASRSLIKALPLIGIAVSASANKLVTTAVGWRCAEALARRREAEVGRDDTVVDARVS